MRKWSVVAVMCASLMLPTLARVQAVDNINVQGSSGARAAGPCLDKAKSNRYVDCGNGTVTDTVTGLVWLKQADCLSSLNWADGKAAVAGLKNGQCNLTDGSSAGDWRVPSQADWSATIEGAVKLGCVVFGPGTAPSLTNDAGTKCLSAGPSSFTGVKSGTYWTSTAVENNGPTFAWIADLGIGAVSNNSFNSESSDFWVWAVRGGSR